MTACLNAELRTFTDIAGRTLEGELISVTGDSVTIRRIADDQTFTVNASNFCDADRLFFQAKSGILMSPSPVISETPAATVGTPADLAPLRLLLKTSSAKSDRLSKAEMYDDQQQVVKFRVEVKNEELKRHLQGAKATLVIFAKPILQPNLLQVVGKEQFNVEVNALSSFSYEQPGSIRLVYDNKESAKYGFKYSGFICVLQDAQGKIIQADANPVPSAKYGESALKLEVGHLCKRDYTFVQMASYRP